MSSSLLLCWCGTDYLGAKPLNESLPPPDDCRETAGRQGVTANRCKIGKTTYPFSDISMHYCPSYFAASVRMPNHGYEGCQLCYRFTCSQNNDVTVTFYGIQSSFINRWGRFMGKLSTIQRSYTGILLIG